jgi:hypothetical protein
MWNLCLLCAVDYSECKKILLIMMKLILNCDLLVSVLYFLV